MKILEKFLDCFRALLLGDFPGKLNTLIKQTEINSMLLAKLHIQKIREVSNIKSLKDVEFKVFSQWGEDGIIQYILSKIPIENEIFIEFGVENYTESNTRFLLINDNWKGLVIDGNPKHIEYIKKDPIYWQYSLTAICEFITRENINDVIALAGISGDIGLLSIDIDGNDYWVWSIIDVISPRIVICEYNSVLGSDYAITVPYDPHFIAAHAHYSGMYLGCSLPALCKLADSKGYNFIGSNSSGCNAFFIRKDLSHPFNAVTAKQGYVESKIRTSRDKYGDLTYLSGKDRLDVIADLDIYDLELGTTRPLKELLTR
ncbi:conserved hypothetical protein [Desulfofarcimen acetoxidans DSM 771]|uniref:Uncharacterized protein n=1 Tax=Desulfofarcimen acetoxidans (strain ATCC 49208 / DSM 771 / KCTC 5769 / VKM B-1644 / 5575) TaxID=485916 RepID=C8W1X9_DESAS|nr:hypothetical protein [Desulfofarcimen acetoxidans]ACV63600.1 conserved hypothetical protein [Desulfofarcimen acetoxidans DSM 771]